MTREGKLAPAKKVFALGAELGKRVARDGDKVVYRIAEDSLEPPGRNCSLKKGTALVKGEGGVEPTCGETMLKVSCQLGAREKGKSFTHLTRYLSTVDVIPIVKGMTFSYDVRSEGSPYDNFALDLRIAMPDGRPVPKIADANGVPMNNLHQHRSPSLEGRADGKWYHREFDLSPAAGGWIDMITLCCIRPSGAAYPAGELKMYVDDIKLTWPREQQRATSVGTAGEGP